MRGDNLRKWTFLFRSLCHICNEVPDESPHDGVFMYLNIHLCIVLVSRYIRAETDGAARWARTAVRSRVIMRLLPTSYISFSSPCLIHDLCLPCTHVGQRTRGYFVHCYFSSIYSFLSSQPLNIYESFGRGSYYILVGIQTKGSRSAIALWVCRFRWKWPWTRNFEFAFRKQLRKRID